MGKEHKKKSRNLVLDWLAYAGLRVLVAFLGLFSIRANLRTACFLGRLLWKYYHRGRQRAMDNLQVSFPDRDQDWCQQVGRRSFEQLVMLVMDVLFTPRLVHKENWKDYAKFHDIEQTKWRMKSGPGMILVTAHYGNFEIVGYMLGLFGFDIYSVARPLDNPFINRWLYGVRQRRGQKIVDKKGATEQMETILTQGSTLGFIADQDAGKKGLFVDFFGRKASTYKSIGLLAIQYNLPVCVGYSRRRGNDFFFDLCASRMILPEEWADKDNPLLWLTQEYTAAIEAFIREDPTQYWWIHRRWKTRPKEERRALELRENPS
ncbi:MAG: lipid A biosynthesis acyltransferase [Phycisphaerae bacterium]|nr:lipid A biosynthesis acyltransferase [Phycisphaerae bacterium]